MASIRVKSISIQNFKGIKHLDLDFTYPNSPKTLLNNIVIYGVNGSGKSTILEAIYLCLIVASTYQGKVKGIDLLRTIEDYLVETISLGSEWIHNDEEKFVLKITIIDNKKELIRILTYHKTKGLEWSGGNGDDLSKDFKQSFTFLSSYRLLNPSTVQNAGDWSEIERIEDDIAKNRFISRRSSNFIRREVNYFPSLSLQFENNYKTVKQFLVNLITDKKVEAITDKNQMVLDKIKIAFKIFFPNKEFLEQLSRTDNLKDYRLMIKNEDGSIVDLDQLSSGEREIIAFFTFLCTKSINNSILIIDEPELHLHAKWQSILLYAIREIFPDSQLFLATHSNEIYQSASDSEIFEVEKE